ncbi:MAG: hypothetical protein IKZ81_02190, partial [Clostridia bacterium]|nr:hypothetical protein [Clostridia bacterium]
MGNTVFITGMSGAGKSRAINALEDMGYYCVDNLPASLATTFADLVAQSRDKLSNVAIVIDSRDGENVGVELSTALRELSERNVEYKVLFLEASTAAVVRRYRETRRRHPLARSTGGDVVRATENERRLLMPLRSMADYIIDTSNLSPVQLRERIVSLFSGSKDAGIMISCSVLIAAWIFSFSLMAASLYVHVDLVGLCGSKHGNADHVPAVLADRRQRHVRARFPGVPSAPVGHDVALLNPREVDGHRFPGVVHRPARPDGRVDRQCAGRPAPCRRARCQARQDRVPLRRSCDSKNATAPFARQRSGFTKIYDFPVELRQLQRVVLYLCFLDGLCHRCGVQRHRAAA